MSPLSLTIAVCTLAPAQSELTVQLQRPLQSIPIIEPWQKIAAEIDPRLKPAVWRRNYLYLGIDPYQIDSYREQGIDMNKPFVARVEPQPVLWMSLKNTKLAKEQIIVKNGSDKLQFLDKKRPSAGFALGLVRSAKLLGKFSGNRLVLAPPYQTPGLKWFKKPPSPEKQLEHLQSLPVPKLLKRPEFAKKESSAWGEIKNSISRTKFALQLSPEIVKIDSRSSAQTKEGLWIEDPWPQLKKKRWRWQSILPQSPESVLNLAAQIKPELIVNYLQKYLPEYAHLTPGDGSVQLQLLSNGIAYITWKTNKRPSETGAWQSIQQKGQKWLVLRFGGKKEAAWPSYQSRRGPKGETIHFELSPHQLLPALAVLPKQTPLVKEFPQTFLSLTYGDLLRALKYFKLTISPGKKQLRTQIEVQRVIEKQASPKK